MIPVQAAIGGKIIAGKALKDLKKTFLQKFMVVEPWIESVSYLKNKKRKS